MKNHKFRLGDIRNHKDFISLIKGLEFVRIKAKEDWSVNDIIASITAETPLSLSMIRDISASSTSKQTHSPRKRSFGTG